MSEPVPICGRCRIEMTRENSRQRPELFLCDACAIKAGFAKAQLDEPAPEDLSQQVTKLLRQQVTKLAEENDQLRKSFLLSQEARSEWLKNLDAMRNRSEELVALCNEKDKRLCELSQRIQDFDFCKQCNSPLSMCGEQNPDGTPTLDCLVCRLREQIKDWEKRWDESPYPASEVAQEQIKSLRARVEEMETTNWNHVKRIAELEDKLKTSGA